MAGKMVTIKEYFATDSKPVTMAELKALSLEDRTQLAQGIESGTLTY